MKSKLPLIAAGIAGLSQATTGLAQEEPTRPDDHAPIGVMGDHFHEAGEFMFSYRYMTMSMEDNAIGSSGISPDQIVTTIPNRFAPPPTLRVVPTRMTMDMHMLGLMYAPNDRITLMAMANHISKEMDHITYMGMMGTNVLGGFRVETEGLGDTSLAALMRLHESDRSRSHFTVGFSIPTGDTDATATVLSPMNTTPVLRVPYPMQLGSGTYDVLAGYTYARFLSDQSSFGMQWRGVIRTGDNDEGYSLGDEHRLTGWYARQFTDRLSWSARLEYYDRANIDGLDPLIAAPVQTADPDRQGASRFEVGLGINISLLGGHRFGFEYLSTIDQDLDGPQLEVDDQLIFGYQLSF